MTSRKSKKAVAKSTKHGHENQCQSMDIIRSKQRSVQRTAKKSAGGQKTKKLEIVGMFDRNAE